MNTRIILICAFLITNLLFISCEKEDKVARPEISELELGIGNNHVAYIGSDLHIEAEIVAEGVINQVIVEIHQEEGSSEEIVATFDEFAGKKNTTFHKHIDIPDGTTAGTYHCHLTVTDKEGYETTVEEEISLEELADTEAPTLTMSTTPESGKSFTNGQTISISGTVTDNNALGGLLVALVKETDNITDDNVSGTNTSVIVMLHTHDFSSPKSHAFTASIVVGATNDNNMTPAPIQGNNAWRTGNYYILVKGKDAKNNAFQSSRYPIVLK